MKFSLNHNLLLLGLLLLTSLVSCKEEEEVPMPDPNNIAATITLTNVGANAYVVASISGDGATAVTGEQNVAIGLRTGMRYRFVNNGGAGHPLEFLSASNAVLLAQNNQTGSFESNAAVNFIVDGNSITFTLTSTLAAEMAKYRCSFHPGMLGAITISN